jgi:hypothetical protein
MTKNFNYYDDWRSVELECPLCHWKGKFNEGAVEYFRELQDCSCPRCDCDASPALAMGGPYLVENDQQIYAFST